MSQHIDRYYQIIKRSHVTEKATTDGLMRNAYHFRVPKTANKVEIRRAVESLFDVKVEAVNTLRVKGKSRRRGWVKGQKPDWKKAMVTLKEGDTIDVI
ncbi:MAG: 50S ribosomal protein L23 [Planctomycetota bacterium]